MFSFTTVKDYHERLLRGDTSCMAAVQHYLAAIDSTRRLNAYLEIFREEALARAAALDASRHAGEPLGKLHGVVVSIKDVICYAGHTVSAASRILEKFNSIYSATAVERLLSEGAIIIGRTNCDEFAMGSSNENSAFGPVLNALDETRVSGGSSGGSAVSVQAGLCMISLGSDTGGSVRQPADFCGIVGLKPAYGTVSRHGLLAYASSFDQIGIFSLIIDDAFLALSVIEGPDKYDSTLSGVKEVSATGNRKNHRLAYFKQCLEHPGLDPEIRARFYGFTEKLTQQGYSVEPVDFQLFDYIVPTYYILTAAEASSNLGRYDGVRYGYRAPAADEDLADWYARTRSAGFGPEVRRRIFLGTFVLSEEYYNAYFTQAQRVRRLLMDRIQALFQQYDGLISPTVPSVAFELGNEVKDPVEMFLADIYTVLANLTGIPAISLPLFNHSIGMPFGLQLMVSRSNAVSLHSLSNKLMAFKQ